MNGISPADGRVALVTGGGGDLGRALARRLARAGLAVAVADLDEGRAAGALKEIEAGGGRGIALPVDVTSAAAFRACIDRVEDELGPLGLLVNNAGLEGDVAPISDYP
jgi:NAD(P)-dependent dehydrogenase (short-subunit alcohol dehydrogenase family)